MLEDLPLLLSQVLYGLQNGTGCMVSVLDRVLA